LSEIKKICILSDWMHGLPDEGIHNLAQSLLDQWKTARSVRALRIGADLSVNRLFLGGRLRAALQEISPDLIVYISSSSAKVAALFRAKVLKIYSPRAKVFVIATQPVHHGRFGRRLAALLAPDGIFVQSPGSMEELRHIPCPVHFLPSGVDTSRFVPVDETGKRELRRKHKVDEGAFLVLHVGHINRGRNVQVLEEAARLGHVQFMLVGSTSTPHDEELARQLIQAGVRLIREFVPRIEEIYQLADAYIFPVVSEDAAIGVPLSVLESMACNLPVITTPFGGLPWMFRKGDGFVYFDGENNLAELIDDVRRLEKSSTRRMVEPYDWKNVASGAMEMIQSRKRSR
jgi:glycosyltransferase involved in cell wall biosynthesis